MTKLMFLSLLLPALAGLVVFSARHVPRIRDVAALLGVLSAGVSHAIRRVLATLPAISGARSQLVSASASVLTGGVVVYVVGRLLIP